jgi:hypothetical protein
MTESPSKLNLSGSPYKKVPTMHHLDGVLSPGSGTNISLRVTHTGTRKGDKNTIQFSVTTSRGGKNNGWYAHFLEFGLLPKDRERLELQWNIEFNGNLDLDINKVPIGFQFAKMYNGEFPNDIRPEKRRSLVFNMMQGSSLLAYGVGLGKTYCAIYNLAQNLEYGFCKRPLIILPNQVYPQFIKEISGLIPQYKINRLFKF